MSTIDVSNGTVEIGVTLDSGDVMIVQNGGTTEETLIQAGGTETVLIGGLDEHATVESGGSYALGFGGKSLNLVVNGGTAEVSGVVGYASITNNGGIDVLNQGEVLGSTLEIDGYMDVQTGGLAYATVVDGHLIVEAGGTASLSRIGFDGLQAVMSGGQGSSTTIGNGGINYVFDGGTETGDVIENGGTMLLRGNGASNTNLHYGGTLDLLSIPYYVQGGVTAHIDGSNVLSVIENSITYTQQLVGDYTGLLPLTISDTGTGTDIVLIDVGGPPCFAAGTRLATPGGPVAVEALRIGDAVVTRSGAARAIVWIGTRDMRCDRHADPDSVRPVRIRAHAFGENVPARDVLLSPDHAVFAEGVLIPVRLLVDGVGIVRTAQDRVRYFHVELATHDVVLAEGLPVETYLDTGNRSAFANGGSIADLHACFTPAVDETAWEAMACAKLRVTGPELDRVRAQLAARAAARAKARVAV